MNKKTIRLTESDLHRIIKESVNKVLNEISSPKRGMIEKSYKKPNGQKVHVKIDSISPNDNYCAFEYWEDTDWQDMDNYIEGGIWIEDGWVADFEGCAVLPIAVKNALAEMGIQAD